MKNHRIRPSSETKLNSLLHNFVFPSFEFSVVTIFERISIEKKYSFHRVKFQTAGHNCSSEFFDRSLRITVRKTRLNSKVRIDASSNTRAQDARYPDFIARRIIHRPRLYTGWSIVGRKLRKRKLAGVTVTGADVGHVLPRRRRCGSVISNAERGWRKGDGEIRGGFLSRKPRYWNDQPPKAVPRPLHFANYALTMRAPDTPEIPFLSQILASDNLLSSRSNQRARWLR